MNLATIKYFDSVDWKWITYEIVTTNDSDLDKFMVEYRIVERANSNYDIDITIDPISTPYFVSSKK